MVSCKQPMIQPDANYFYRFVHSSGCENGNTELRMHIKRMSLKNKAASKHRHWICLFREKQGGINGAYLEEWDTVWGYLYRIGYVYSVYEGSFFFFQETEEEKKINGILQMPSKTTLNSRIRFFWKRKTQTLLHTGPESAFWNLTLKPWKICSLLSI